MDISKLTSLQFKRVKIDHPHKSNVSLLYLLGFVILLAAFNGMLEWASLFFNYKRYFISIELLIALFFIAIRNYWIALLLSLIFIACEAILGATSLLYFSDYGHISIFLRFIHKANTNYILGGIGFLLGTLSFLFLSAFLLKRIKKNHFFIFLISIIALQIVIGLRVGGYFSPNLAKRKNILLGSSLWFSKIMMDENRKLFIAFGPDNVDYPEIKWPSAANQTFGDMTIADKLPNKILFIISESWGLPYNIKILESQLNPLYKDNLIKKIKMGEVQTLGATVFGEFRELCEKIPSKLNFFNINEAPLENCLPNVMRNKGYKTISMHAADETAYDRTNWYPVIGIDEMFFRKELSTMLKKGDRLHCYSFPGLCDDSLFTITHNILNSDEKVFLYWLTLNSHHPFDKRDIINYNKNICERDFHLGYDEGLCNYHNMHFQFFNGLAKMIRSDNLSGVEVLIVGDHPPPLNSEIARSYFNPRKVPFLYFIIA